MRPLTDHTPKPLLPLGAAPFLLGVIDRLAAVGVRRVFLVVGADTAPFEVLREPAAQLGVTLVAVPEPEPLDTAGGVRAAIAQVDGPTWVLNGDVLTDIDLAAMAAHHRAHEADATLSLTLVDDTSSFGVCVREGTRIVDFVEKPPPGSLPGQRGVNAGTYLLEPDVMDAFPQGRLSFERDVFPGILADGGHVEGFAWEGVWADLGTPDRYRCGHRLVLDGAMAWPAVTAVVDRGDGVRVDPTATIDPSAALVGPCLVAADAVVGSGATVGPHATLGAGARIGGGATVTDSVLRRGAVVGTEVIARGLLAGIEARVPDGCRLGRDVVVGDRIELPADVDDESRHPA